MPKGGVVQYGYPNVLSNLFSGTCLCQKNMFFEWMHLFCVGTKYLVLLQLLLLYTIAILSSNYDEEK